MVLDSDGTLTFELEPGDPRGFDELGPLEGVVAPHQRAAGRWGEILGERPIAVELELLERDIGVAIEDFDRRHGVDVSDYGRVEWPALDLRGAP